MAVEEPKFVSVRRDGKFEVRDYPALVAAEVTVTGAQAEAARKGFRLLAGYIFGGNKRKQSIAMTAPVAQVPTSQKIAMTAPVAQTQVGNGWVVRFTMPSTFTLATLPEPNDPAVQLRVVPAARFAVLVFSGRAKADIVASKMAELDAWVKAQNLTKTGAISLSQYNPPWTLGFLRRNEVMVPIATGD